jgi:hypothetical protein
MKKLLVSIAFMVMTMSIIGCELNDGYLIMPDMYKVSDKHVIAPAYIIEVTNINTVTHDSIVYVGGTLKLDITVDIATYNKYNVGDLWMEPLD